MSKQDKIQKDFLLPDLKKDGVKLYLQKIRKVASDNRGSEIKLKKVEEYSFKVGTLEETSYKDEPDMVDEWEQFYLPEHMFMEVIGVFEEFPCCSPNGDLVLMVCEDEKVFAFEDETLHLVSNNLEELFKNGLQFPGTEQYYRGQTFEDMTEEDWDRVRESDGLKEKRKEHQELLESMKDSFLNNLNIIMGRKRVVTILAACNMHCLMNSPLSRRAESRRTQEGNHSFSNCRTGTTWAASCRTFRQPEGPLWWGGTDATPASDWRTQWRNSTTQATAEEDKRARFRLYGRREDRSDKTDSVQARRDRRVVRVPPTEDAGPGKPSPPSGESRLRHE
ncbi:uncharacterized protein LOC128600985 [Ictalurus furcatus]|uniref:uncharacterized protein LOC128600985 n=1 Tax=Ictalurus furcatus TaxID=66913 RepID=UPI002350A082|nr:uncharacterized protein LOC128600985 [Ictalurus furcatus]